MAWLEDTLPEQLNDPVTCVSGWSFGVGRALQEIANGGKAEAQEDYMSRGNNNEPSPSQIKEPENEQGEDHQDSSQKKDSNGRNGGGYRTRSSAFWGDVASHYEKRNSKSNDKLNGSLSINLMDAEEAERMAAQAPLGGQRKGSTCNTTCYIILVYCCMLHLYTISIMIIQYNHHTHDDPYAIILRTSQMS